MSQNATPTGIQSRDVTDLFSSPMLEDDDIPFFSPVSRMGDDEPISGSTTVSTSLRQFHLKGKHNQKSHGGNAAHVPDVTDTVKTSKGHVGAVDGFLVWKGKDWLRVSSQPGKQKWFEPSSLKVVSKGVGVGEVEEKGAGTITSPAIVSPSIKTSLSSIPTTALPAAPILASKESPSPTPTPSVSSRPVPAAADLPSAHTPATFVKDLLVTGWEKIEKPGYGVEAVYDNFILGTLTHLKNGEWNINPAETPNVTISLGNKPDFAGMTKFTKSSTVDDNRPVVGRMGARPVEVKPAAMKAHYAAWLKGLSDREKEAILLYVGDTIYDSMNGNLRKGLPVLDGLKEHISHIDAALSRSSVPVDMTVFRAVDNDVVASWKVGGTYQDKGFVSTTANKAIAEGWSGEARQIRVSLPKGSHGASIRDITHGRAKAIGAEEEILLPRGTKFKVIAITDAEIHVEVVP